MLGREGDKEATMSLGMTISTQGSLLGWYDIVR